MLQGTVQKWTAAKGVFLFTGFKQENLDAFPEWEKNIKEEGKFQA